MIVALVMGSLPLAFTLFVVIGILRASKRNAIETERKRALLRSGTRGRARIKQIRQLASRPHGRALELELSLEILATQENAAPIAPFAHSVVAVVPSVAVGSVQPNAVVPIRCSATRPPEVLIDLPALGFVE